MLIKKAIPLVVGESKGGSNLSEEHKLLAEEGYNHLERRGISRRDFVKMVSLTCVAFGLDLTLVPKIAESAAALLSKKPLVWMQGQSCTGCSISLLATENPGSAELLLDVLSVRYHPNLMAAAGDEAIDSLEQCVEKGNYILVLEGSIPTADPRYCMVEGKDFAEQFKEVAANAELIIAAGSCSCYGGIPRAGLTGAVGAQDLLDKKDREKLINLPSCPVKPDRLVGAIIYYLGHNKLPRLDKEGRPVAYYNYTMHDSCYRRLHYERGEFLEDWNNARTANWCLYQKGCKGKETFTDCASRWWNNGANFCVAAGSPCSGCSQPEYYDELAPLFSNSLEVKPE